MRFLLTPNPSTEKINFANLLLRKYVHDFAKNLWTTSLGV